MTGDLATMSDPEADRYSRAIAKIDAVKAA
jgi:hypothetical protein